MGHLAVNSARLYTRTELNRTEFYHSFISSNLIHNFYINYIKFYVIYVRIAYQVGTNKGIILRSTA